MNKEEAFENVRFSEVLITDFIAPEDYLAEAFMEALNHDHSVYDMLYLCLARRNAATLFTRDKKLMELCLKAKVNCIEEVDLVAE